MQEQQCVSDTMAQKMVSCGFIWKGGSPDFRWVLENKQESTDKKRKSTWDRRNTKFKGTEVSYNMA